MTAFANIPMKSVGPIKLCGPEVQGEITAPLATYETPLWPSVKRGAKVSMLTDGINAFITDERMTRSIVLEAKNGTEALNAIAQLKTKHDEFKTAVETSSRFAKLIDVHYKQIANLIYIRFEYTTGDAAGHNMVTLASEHIQQWILKKFSELKYVSISGNMCIDKKASSINAIRGRGKSVIAEIKIPRDLCKKLLRATPESIVELNIKKNLLGSNLAGSIHSANAHYANMLLAFYLATGQDAANIVEGSQGITYATVADDHLYFSVNLPNIIVGTIGNGKELNFVQKNLEMLGCMQDAPAGQNARRLAIICGATVLCGELSLLAAQTNEGELMRGHVGIERKARTKA
ncbi:MAG: hydroxymethylglutaryl-CoA reductase [Gammaproteobacteria bacterium]